MDSFGRWEPAVRVAEFDLRIVERAGEVEVEARSKQGDVNTTLPSALLAMLNEYRAEFGPHQSAHDREAFARALGQTLLPDAVASLFGRTRSSARGRVRVRLRLDPSLERMPWELARFSTGDGTWVPLALLDGVSVVRHVALPFPSTGLTPEGSVSALLCSTRGRVDDAVRARLDGWNVDTVGPEATWGAFRAALLRGPTVVHYTGEGSLDSDGKAALEFCNEGLTKYVAIDDLVPHIRAEHTKVVVLACCHSAPIAAELARQGVAIAIGTHERVENYDIELFSMAFLERVGAGAELDVAVSDARRALHDNNSALYDLSSPALYMRTTQARLFSGPLVRSSGRSHDRRFATPPATDDNPVVLIVDDEDADDIAEQLPGFRHVLAWNGDEALQILRSSQRIDLAIVDMMLGEDTAQSGRDLLEAINADSLRREIPKIVVSLDPQLGTKNHGAGLFKEQYVVFEMLWKPPDGGPIGNLAAVVGRALELPASEVVLAQLERRAHDFAREIMANLREDGKEHLLWVDGAKERCKERIEGVGLAGALGNRERWDAYEEFVAAGEKLLSEVLPDD